MIEAKLIIVNIRFKAISFLHHGNEKIPRSKGSGIFSKQWLYLLQALLHPADHSYQEEQNYRPGEGRDDVIHNAGADGDVQEAEQPAADEGSEDTDDDRADTAGSHAADQPLGQQTGDSADNDPNYD